MNKFPEMIKPGQIVVDGENIYCTDSNGKLVCIKSMQYVNTAMIMNSKDLIEAFDELQNRAIELGYPISSFNKPISIGKGENEMYTYVKVKTDDIDTIVRIK